MSKKWSGEINEELVVALLPLVQFTNAEYARITAHLNAQGCGPFTVKAVT